MNDQKNYLVSLTKDELDALIDLAEVRYSENRYQTERSYATSETIQIAEKSFALYSKLAGYARSIDEEKVERVERRFEFLKNSVAKLTGSDKQEMNRLVRIVGAYLRERDYERAIFETESLITELGEGRQTTKRSNASGNAEILRVEILDALN